MHLTLAHKEITTTISENIKAKTAEEKSAIVGTSVIVWNLSEKNYIL